MFCLIGVYYSYGQAPVANFSASPVQGCTPLIVSFTDQSTGSPTGWSWNFGNGNTSGQRNPTTTYSTPGTYTVTLTVTNAAGSNTLTRSQYITVHENPVPNFSAVNTSGCYPLPVSFSDQSTPGNGNSISSWLWDFGDGGTSTQQNPIHSYTTSGLYSVSLRITNNKGCTKVLVRTNYVNVLPGVDAQFTNTAPTVCRAPATITFTNNSTGPGSLTYAWSFGDGGVSSVQNPVYTYSTNGTYTPRLIVYSSSGCVDTMYGTPIVVGSAFTDFTYPTQICINDTAFFNNISTPSPSGTTWDFGDGNTITGLNSSHRYAATGSYTVKLFNTYSNCADSAIHTVVVNGLPNADFDAPVKTRCEPPLTVNFQDLTSPTITSWQWDFGDGGFSTLQNPSHTYNAYGNYTVKLIVTNSNGCKDTIIKTDFVRIRRAQITIPEIPFRDCVPATFQPVPVINSLDNVLTYNWDFGDGGTSTAANPTHIYNAQGNYDVRLIITTSDGCTDTLLAVNGVRVGTHPVVDFTASPVPVCADQPVQFTDLSAPADQWNWDFGDNQGSSLRNPTHRYQDTGYFSVRLIATNNGCSDTLVKSNIVYVLPPLARFNYSVDCSNKTRVLFRDSSILPLSWNWDFGDGGTSNINNPIHVYPSLGTYSVRLIVTNGGCIDTVIRTVKLVDEQPDFTSDIRTLCRGSGVNFQVINSNYSNIVNYYWDFGDGNTSNTNAATIANTYGVSGTYTVTMTATDINGCTSTVTKPNYIRVNGPTAAFNANTDACINVPHTFNDLSTTDGVNAIVNWKWDFGDGTIQNFSGPPFTHTYTSDNGGNSLTVKLEITDASGCKDSLRFNNYITVRNPQPHFTISDTLTCTGSTVTFTNGSFPFIVASNWDFGDGNTSTIVSPTHAYTDTGYYNVELLVTDQFGCRDSLTQLVNVRDPKAGFIPSDTASSCSPFRVSFTNTSIHFTSVLWDFGPGEGTSTNTNPIHYYSTPGTYTIKLVIQSAGGCRDSIAHDITLYDTSGSRIDYTPVSGCKPLSVAFSTLTPGPMNSYFWDFGDGITDTTTTTSTNHVYNTYGNYTPTLIMVDPTGCIIPLPGLSLIRAIGAEANLGAADSVFCDVASVQFADSTTFNDPIVSYNWSFGDGGSSALQNPSHNYSSPGLYTVSLIVTTQNNCIDTFTKQDYIRVVQRPLINIGGDTLGCVNTPMTHLGQFIQPDTSLVAWAWTFPNGASSTLQNPPGQLYSTPGNYTVSVIATNSTGCMDTTSRPIEIKPLPTVTMPPGMSIQSGYPVQIPATYSPNTVAWNWSPPTGLGCTNCPSPVAGPKFTTNYSVLFTDIFGCTNHQDILVTVLCKNSNVFIPNSFSPNNDGSNDIFYPRGKGLGRAKLLRIYNRWGEIVFEKRDFNVNDPSAGWNGSYKGTRPIAGVYIFQAEIYCENGELITLNGNVALIL